MQCGWKLSVDDMVVHELKEAVWRANLEIVKAGLVTLTWGNVSGVEREAGIMAIKPSGVSYDRLRPEDIVLVALDDGRPIDKNLKPSSDTPTHLHLYRAFEDLGGIVHTHSKHAVSWAQAERPIPCFGTTHADHFFGSVPVTRRMLEDEIRSDYELNTGVVIVEHFRREGIHPTEMPAVLVAGHGPFVWGPTPQKAVEAAIALETVAEIALNTLLLRAAAAPIDDVLLEKHYLRKHGPNAYYGQHAERNADEV